MKLFVHLVEPLVGDVGVNLRGGDGGVAEHLLDRTDVGTINEQLSGEGVAKNMRGDAFDDAGVKRGRTHNVFNGDGRETMFLGERDVVN